MSVEKYLENESRIEEKMAEIAENVNESRVSAAQNKEEETKNAAENAYNEADSKLGIFDPLLSATEWVGEQISLASLLAEDPEKVNEIDRDSQVYMESANNLKRKRMKEGVSPLLGFGEDVDKFLLEDYAGKFARNAREKLQEGDAQGKIRESIDGLLKIKGELYRTGNCKKARDLLNRHLQNDKDRFEDIIEVTSDIRSDFKKYVEGLQGKAEKLEKKSEDVRHEMDKLTTDRDYIEYEFGVKALGEKYDDISKFTDHEEQVIEDSAARRAEEIMDNGGIGSVTSKIKEYAGNIKDYVTKSKRREWEEWEELDPSEYKTEPKAVIADRPEDEEARYWKMLFDERGNPRSVDEVKSKVKDMGEPDYEKLYIAETMYKEGIQESYQNRKTLKDWLIGQESRARAEQLDI